MFKSFPRRHHCPWNPKNPLNTARDNNVLLIGPQTCIMLLFSTFLKLMWGKKTPLITSVLIRHYEHQKEKNNRWKGQQKMQQLICDWWCCAEATGLTCWTSHFRLWTKVQSKRHVSTFPKAHSIHHDPQLSKSAPYFFGSCWPPKLQQRALLPTHTQTLVMLKGFDVQDTSWWCTKPRSYILPCIRKAHLETWRDFPYRQQRRRSTRWLPIRWWEYVVEASLLS